VIQVNETIAILDDELDWSYARSGGPGGQNVNKVSSKAVLRWFAARSVAPIPLTAWTRMKARFPSRFTVEGEVVISSQEYRDQERNREACEAKLGEMIRVSLVEPTPRKKAKVSKAAKRRRVEDKRRLSAKKQGRKSGGSE
jgi:ribosome-associated protein